MIWLFFLLGMASTVFAKLALENDDYYLVVYWVGVAFMSESAILILFGITT